MSAISNLLQIWWITNMCKYSLSKITQAIREYNLKKILDSGENNMIDEHIDKKTVENLLQQKDEQTETKTTVDLKSTLKNIQETNLYESIINLKNNI